MSKRYPGGLITKTPVVPTSLSAPGIWSLSDQAAAQATNTWPFPRDPQFKYVTMLLHGDGSGGPTSLGMGAGASPTVTNFNADASTNNFNVTINGDARSNNFNPYQAGYYSNYFDGSGDYLSVADANALDFAGDFTVEAWVFVPTTSASARTIIHKADTNVGYALVMIPAGNIEVQCTSLQFNSTSTLPLNQWNHLALVRSGSSTNNVKFYLNGVQDGQGTNTSNTATAITLGIGAVARSGAAGVNPINGYISNVRLVASAVYTTTFTPPTAPLTAITNTSLLTCQSNRFIDNSTNAFTLTKNGDTAVSPAIPFTLPSSVATYGSGFFDGSGDTLNTTSNAAFGLGTSAWTFEAFVYPTVAQTDNWIIATNDAGKLRMRVGASGYLSFFTDTGSISLNSTTVVTVNAWSHVAICYDGTTLSLFQNGTRTATSTVSISNGSANACYIGSNTIGGSFWNGYISDARVVKGTAVYSGATYTVPTTPLTAITNTSLLTTQYNGGGNNSGFKDSSQFNFPITRNGNTTQGTFTPYGSNWSSYLGTNGNYFTSGTNAALGFSTGNWTIEFFLNVTQFVDNQFLIDFRPSGSGGATQPLIYLTTAGTLLYFTASATRITSSTGVITAGTWAHIAVARASGSTRMFVNGVQTGSTYTDSNDYGSSARFVNGTYGDAPGATNNNGGVISGYISNLRILKGTGLYTGSYTVPTSPLTAITNTSCLTFQSNRFVDNSSNGIAITPTGSPSVQRFSPFAPLTVYNPATIGGSGYFDGSGDGLTSATSSAFAFGTGDFTYEGYYYSLDTGSSQRGMFDTRVNQSSTAGVLLREDSSGFLVYINGGTLFTASGRVANTWQHIALIRQSGTIRLYVNGVQANSAANTTNFTDTNCRISGFIDTQASPYGYFGYISNARVLKGTCLYPSGTTFTPPTAPLTAITNTSLLLNLTNAGILDNAMMNDLETVGNAQISTSVKKYGTGSMYFDGSGDYLTVPSTPNLAFGGNFTVEAWLYLTSYPSSANAMYVCDFRNGSTSNFGFGVIGSAGVAKPYAFVGSGPVEATGSTSLSLNTWYHIAMVRSGSTVTYYLNGVSDATMTTSFSQGATGVTVGARYTGSTEYVAGYIDDLRITKGVARYTANFTVPDQAFPNG